MNYKVVIDAGHGGVDSGNSGNGLIEKDYALLISNYIKKRLDDLGISNIITRSTDRDLSISERIDIMRDAYGIEDNVLVVSNHLNKGGEEGLEIIYALRDDDDFASLIADQVEQAGGVVNKYYQLRDPDDTVSDYYTLIKDTPEYETVMIEYGYVDNLNDASRIKEDYLDYAEAVVRAIAIYTGNDYVPLPGDNYYVVKKGDSLWKIANSYGISVEDLKSANNLKSNVLQIGQLLLIPSFESEEEDNSNIYVVKKGDSLWKIANSYGVSVEDLKSANNLSSNVLQIGQKLVIPNSNLLYYTVKKGDSLWKIANSYGISVEDLKSVNNLSSDILQIGQKLVIPNSNLLYYTVKKGDSLWKIANSYGVSVEELKELNKLSTDLLQIGQELKISVKS